MNTVKNCYSAAGMSYVPGTAYRYLTDCPKCKYGTLMWERYTDAKGYTVTSTTIRNCIDCNSRFEKCGDTWKLIP